MKIAVTAASGSLGSLTVKKAIQKMGEDKVVAFARNPEKIKGLPCEVRKGDYDEEKDFEESLYDIDVLLLISSNADPDIRIHQHMNVIDAAQLAGIKKLVYTSIVGREGGSYFDKIVASNRKTESYIIESPLDWIICRNGLYLDPDLSALEQYRKEGRIRNCAGEGKCGYTSRDELAEAYLQLMLDTDIEKRIFNLTGESITQQQLAEYFNEVYDTHLVYEDIPYEEYLEERIQAHGEFYGKIIAGIYYNIRQGVLNVKTDYETAVGKEHKSISKIMREFKDK